MEDQYLSEFLQKLPFDENGELYTSALRLCIASDLHGKDNYAHTIALFKLSKVKGTTVRLELLENYSLETS